jgi:hypothetical protein
VSPVLSVAHDIVIRGLDAAVVVGSRT